MNYNVPLKEHTPMCFGSCIEWVSYSNTDTNKWSGKHQLTANLINTHQIGIIIIVTGVERCVWSSRWLPVAIVCIAHSKQVMDVMADSWYIIQMLYPAWHHCKWRRQQQTKFVKLLPEFLQTSILCYGLNDTDAVSTADVFCDISLVPTTSKGHGTFRTSGTTNATTKLHIPEYLNTQIHHCVKLKFHKYFHLYMTINHRTVVWIHLL